MAIILFPVSALPLLLTVCWVTGMSLTTESREECWDDYSNNNSIYIIVVPMVSALAVGFLNKDSLLKCFSHLHPLYVFLLKVNLLFLVSIMKVVVTKLRIQSSLSTQQLQVRQNILYPSSYSITGSKSSSRHLDPVPLTRDHQPALLHQPQVPAEEGA